jgi:N-terminal domain of NWD NACHT-NTPase
VKGLDDIATIISRCIMREALYHQRYESTDHGEPKREFVTSHISYRDALRALYVKILSFQATSVCFLFKNTFSRVTADMVKWNDWDNMLAEIKEQENAFKSIEEQWRDMKYDEECKLHNDRHKQRVRGLSAIEDEVSRVRSAIMQARNDNEREKLLKWLSSVSPSKNYNSARESHALSTGDWLVEKSSDFKNWEKAPNSLLWLHGKGIIPP